MALTKNDLQLLQGMFTAQDQRIRLDLKNALTQQTQNIKRDIRDEMDARFLASENKIDKKMDEKLEKLRREFHQEIKTVIDILLTFVPERFEKLEHDVAHIKTHIGIAT